jgi:hypothetical protein
MSSYGAYGAGPEHKVDPVGTVCSLSGMGVRTCLLPLLQGDSQSGGPAPTVSTAGFPDSTERESRARRAHGHPHDTRFAISVALKAGAALSAC